MGRAPTELTNRIATQKTTNGIFISIAIRRIRSRLDYHLAPAEEVASTHAGHVSHALNILFRERLVPPIVLAFLLGEHRFGGVRDLFFDGGGRLGRQSSVDPMKIKMR